MEVWIWAVVGGLAGTVLMDFTAIVTIFIPEAGC